LICWLQVPHIFINQVVGGLVTSLGFRVIYLAKMVLDSFGACKKLKKKDVNYGSRDMTYWTMVMKLPRFGIQPKKLIEDGHITLDEVVIMFGPKKANGYRSNNLDLDPKVKMQVEELYFKLYPTNEKIKNNEFGDKLYWGIVVERKVVLVNWASLGLEVAKEKAQRGLKGTQIIETHNTTMDKDVVKLEGVVVGSLSMHKPKKTLHGSTMVTNHGRRPIGFTKEKVFGVEELQELKKVN
jgi:hypothetical protein